VNQTGSPSAEKETTVRLEMGMVYTREDWQPWLCRLVEGEPGDQYVYANGEGEMMEMV
jgi:hypothetical protein